MSTVMAPMTIGFDAPNICVPTAPLLVGYTLAQVLDAELEVAVELLWKDEDEDTGWPLFPTPCECECELLCETL